jgi:hypothetical protein
MTDTNELTVYNARIVVKNARVDIEKERKERKAKVLELGRQIDAEPKRLTALLAPIEAHLQAEEDRIDAERLAIKNAAKIKAEAEAAAKKSSEEAALRAEQERVAAERVALDAERAAMEAEKRRVQEEEATRQLAAAAEQARIDTARRRLADAERERQHNEEILRTRVETAERVKKETEARLKREAIENAAAEKLRAEVAEAKRIKAEQLRPDQEKLASVATAVRQIVVPQVSSGAYESAGQIQELLWNAARTIEEIAGQLGTDTESALPATPVFSSNT